MHGTAFAVAAVANRGFSLLFLFDHADDYSGNYTQKHGADNYIPDITCYPLEHKLNSLFYLYFFGKLVSFLIGLEQHKQHARDNEYRNDKSDDIQTARERRAYLEDAQRYRVCEQALVSDGERRPFCRVHLASDRADSREEDNHRKN